MDGSCRLTAAGDRPGVDPQLRPLGDNGGDTMTHALLPGSPARDAAGSTCAATDQRGVARPDGPACDIGAFEYSPPPAVGTPDPFSSASPIARPIGPVICRSGPSVVFPPLTYFEQGQELTLRNRNEDRSWLEVESAGEQPCWVGRNLLELDPALDVMELPPGLIPPTPTWTPLPPTEKPNLAPEGCEVYDSQTQQNVCYPIAQCPVPFEQSFGACTP
jgi:hypothetical protein